MGGEIRDVVGTLIEVVGLEDISVFLWDVTLLPQLFDLLTKRDLSLQCLIGLLKLDTVSYIWNLFRMSLLLRLRWCFPFVELVLLCLREDSDPLLFILQDPTDTPFAIFLPLLLLHESAVVGEETLGRLIDPRFPFLLARLWFARWLLRSSIYEDSDMVLLEALWVVSILLRHWELSLLLCNLIRFGWLPIFRRLSRCSSGFDKRNSSGHRSVLKLYLPVFELLIAERNLRCSLRLLARPCLRFELVGLWFPQRLEARWAGWVLRTNSSYLLFFVFQELNRVVKLCELCCEPYLCLQSEIITKVRPIRTLIVSDRPLCSRWSLSTPSFLHHNNLNI